MISEPFAIGTSPLHRLDPRFKIVAATLFTLIVAVLTRFGALGAALTVSVGLIFIARLGLKDVAKRLLIINTFIFFFWLVLPITVPGKTLWQMGPLTLTREGLVLAARLTLKSNAIVLAFIALVATQPIATVGHALGSLKVPSKLVQLLLLTYRYIFVIEQEYRRLSRSAIMRGFKPKTNLHTYKTYAYMVGILFVRAGLRAERVLQAMRCRGFNGRFHTLHHFNYSRQEHLWSLIFITAMVILGGLEWGGLEWLA